MRLLRRARSATVLMATAALITTLGAATSVVYGVSATADPFSVRANGGLNVRSGPGLNHRIIGGLPTGARVDSTGPSRNGWMPIMFEGQPGWVSDAYLNAIGAGSAPSGTVPAQRGSAYTTTALNVRLGAGLTYRIVTVLAKGTRVETTGVSANGYSQVVHDGRLRWVSSRYLAGSAPSTPAPAGNGLPAIVGTATALAELMIRTTSGTNFQKITDVPAGTVLQLTGVTENGRTQVIHDGQVRWVNSLYLSGSNNVPKPPTTGLPATVATRYATTALILRSSPEDQFINYGDAPTGATLRVTGREVNGRAEVIYNGTVRWVTAHYLAGSAPVVQGGTRITLPGLTPNSQNLLGQVQNRFPQLSTIYGVRPDPIPDHPSGRALDLMVYSNSGLGDAIAEWARANAGALHIDYIIWNQRIWSAARSGEGWRYMADHGSDSANHRNHVHITVR